MKVRMPKCGKRVKVDGVWMCRAIGCCEVGDMACECPDCLKDGKCEMGKELDGPEVHIH